jgi:hypothetical protein
VRFPVAKVMVRVSEPEVAVKDSNTKTPYFLLGLICVWFKAAKRSFVAL